MQEWQWREKKDDDADECERMEKVAQKGNLTNETAIMSIISDSSDDARGE